MQIAHVTEHVLWLHGLGLYCHIVLLSVTSDQDQYTQVSPNQKDGVVKTWVGVDMYAETY